MSASPRDSQGKHAQFIELAAGYALNCLEPEDEEAFTDHLAGCGECREAVEDFRSTAGQLAYGAESHAPSPELRSRLLDAIGHETVVARPIRIDEARPLSRPRRLRPQRSGRPSHVGSFSSSLSMRTLASAAALTALVGAGALITVDQQAANHARSDLRSRTAAMQALLHPGSKFYSLGAKGNASGFAVVDGSNVWLTVDGLPRNDTKASTYVLWAKQGGGALSAVTTFDVTGSSPLVLKTVAANLLPGAFGFAVSYEPGRVAPAKPSQQVLG